MAFAPNVAKKRFENLSIEELEAKYEELKKNYCFNSKEEQIDHIIKNYLNASKDVNDNSTRIALEELLKEKTGKEYKIEPNRFEISLSDIINFITNPDTDPFWTSTLSNYFQKLDEISDEEKMRFLIELVQDKDSFNEFTKEIIQTQNVRETYDKYQKIAQDFVSRNIRKG
ncbi:hypothetical protein IJV57_00180 [Candidatus Saccharibacteria bacterium]|nr:hypothetical protein [Candidatus Saccharibacteria bacterium]